MNEQFHLQALLRLLMLSSTALPVGAYCYSQGTESAIEHGVITDEASAVSYLQDMFTLSLGRYELPMLARLYHALKIAPAFEQSEHSRTIAQCGFEQLSFEQLSLQYKASRETRELLAETRQLAYSLRQWFNDLGPLSAQGQANTLLLSPEDVQCGYVPLLAKIAHYWTIPLADCLTAYAFSVLENQVLAMVKTVPLGQMAGQRILWQVQMAVPALIKSILATLYVTIQVKATLTPMQSMLNAPQPLGLNSQFPGLAMLSMQHERQYSRLFRS